ncbi:VQ motif-containing protein 9 [Camellia lanceoleosa]|uniref:VQ motif-containing protein 9 n=1 Tax=Camellia lanceoleosa TaxID=1840588 RepID=A0ACC0HSG5_9ERIC|nr:VQ motif-containing protein 9 [Camellia lanceoleosa]
MMDKSCHSSGDSTSSSNTTTTNSNNNNNRDQYIRHLNKISHRISKPTRRPTFDQQQQQDDIIQQPPPPPQQTQNLPQQPPVYNIKKSDFRDVVQKLTGSPSHERFSTPPPIHPPKPPSSRLQRIRPPPLAPISNRPPPLLNNAVPPQPPPPTQSQLAPLSPLPPFPAVHTAAESPISAYMRFLQSSFDSDPKRFPGFSPLAPLVSPRWNNLPQPPPQQQHVLPPPTSGSMAQSPFQMPFSPLPFGCFPSPRSPYPLISPSTTGQLGFQPFPLSPTLPVPSPRWKDL